MPFFIRLSQVKILSHKAVHTKGATILVSLFHLTLFQVKKKSPAEPLIFIYFLLVNIYNGGGDLNPEHLRWKYQEVLVELLGSWQLSSGT